MGNKITITGRRRPTIDERYTRPQGLYPHRDVDHRKLRKLIHDAKLAPCYPGAEEPAADLEECPICFLHYPSLNRSKCCTKGICTECFLQMKSPHVSRPTQCPFCKTPNYAVEYRGAKSLEEKGVEQAEEQKVIEAKIRMRQQELQDEEYRVYRGDDDSRHGRAASLPLSATTSTQTLNMSLGDSDCMTVLDAVPGGGREPRMRGSTAGPVGTPQPGMFSTAGLFASPTVAVGPDSLWFRGGQRSEATDLAGGMRQPLLASSTSPSVRMPPANLMAGNGSTGSAVASVVGNIAGIRGGGSTYARLNRLQDSPASRDDEFDLDLEDIMVMEAIWLSIQEQGPQRHEHDTGSVAEETRMSFLSQMIARNQDFRVGENELPTGPAVLSVDSRGPSRRNSVTGGLAGAIAALAERQVVGGAGDGLSSQLDPPDEQFVPAADQSAGLEVELDRAVMESHSSSLAVLGTSNDTDDSHLCTSNDPRAFTRDSGAEIEPGVQTVNIQEQENTCSEFDSGSARVSQFRAAETHSMAESSEGCVEWGAQSARQPVMSDDNKGCAVTSLDEVVDSGPEVALTVSTTLSLQESLQEAQDDANRAIGTGQVIMPETFEEQMMLAMALSLAEVQSMVACGDEQGDEQDISSRAHP